MGFLQPLFWVVVLLGVMILVHELGHFWAALAVGVKVETFSLGLGPRLFGFQRGDTDFRVSAVPFGGYVRMLGEQPAEETAADPRSFQSKARWQRAIVIIAGPLMNVLLAIAIVTGLYMYAFPKEVDTTNPLVTTVDPGSAAADAGMRAGDRIVQIENHKNPNWDDVLTDEALNAGHPLAVVVDRGGKKLNLTVTPRMDAKQGIGVAGWSGQQDLQIGDVLKGSPAEVAGLRTGDLFVSVNHKRVVSPVTVQQAVVQSKGQPVTFGVLRNGQTKEVAIAPTETNDPKMPWRIGISFQLPVKMVKLGFFPAFQQSLVFNRRYGLMIFQVLGSLIEHRVSPKAVTGPIGIAQNATEAAQQGPSSFLFLMAIVSLNLAIFNLLPIPILDGGTLLMLIIEMLLQREVSLQIKETILKLGLVFLMMVVVFVIYNDISRILTRS